MSMGVAAPQLDPLASSGLHRRFPHLGIALDAHLMREQLQALLLDETGLVAQACTPPKAEVKNGTCWLQYGLRVNAPSDDARDVLVLAAMFTDCAAAALEHASLVSLAAKLPPSPAPAPKPTGTLAPLCMAVSVFPVSLALPTLVEATNPQRVAEVLGPIFGRSPVYVETVKFRRTRGCVLRYRLGPGPQQQIVYGKVGSALATAAVAGALAALACTPASPRRGPLIPSLLGYSTELDLALLTGIPGSRADPRDESALAAMVDGAAHVAAWMHGSGVAVDRPHRLDDDLARVRGTIGMIREDAPILAAWLTAVVESLGAIARRTVSQPLVLAHGDFTPSQLMLDGSMTGVLDFDRLCVAEPAFDLGRFLAYLRVALAKVGNPAGDPWATRFLEAYANAGREPGQPDRVEVYTVISLVRMAAHSWQQLKTARLQLAIAVLEERLESIGLRP